MLTIGAFIQVPRPLHGDIADSAISRLTGDITKTMLVAKKIEMQVGGLVPSHFNCIMIGVIIYMQKSNMLNISSYGCWIQLSDIDMHHQQTQPFRAPGQLTGPTFSPVNSPNWSNRCKHSEEIRNLFCPHVLHWIEFITN